MTVRSLDPPADYTIRVAPYMPNETISGHSVLSYGHEG